MVLEIILFARRITDPATAAVELGSLSDTDAILAAKVKQFFVKNGNFFGFKATDVPNPYRPQYCQGKLSAFQYQELFLQG